MLVYSGNGQAHLLCYRPRRPIVDAPQDESASALRGQGVEDRLKVAQFVARLQPGLRAVVHADQVEIGDHLERHDPAAAGRIDDEVAGDLVQIGAAGLDAFDVAGGIGPGHGLCHDIIDIGAIGQHPPQSRPQRAFVWQNGLFVPVESGSDRRVGRD